LIYPNWSHARIRTLKQLHALFYVHMHLNHQRRFTLINRIKLCGIFLSDPIATVRYAPSYFFICLFVMVFTPSIIGVFLLFFYLSCPFWAFFISLLQVLAFTFILVREISQLFFLTQT